MINSSKEKIDVSSRLIEELLVNGYMKAAQLYNANIASKIHKIKIKERTIKSYKYMKGD